MTKLNADRRELEDWEKDECAALKEALATYNALLPREKKLTQDKLAAELGMTQGNLNGHLNGKRALNKEMAARIYALTGIPVRKYSERLDAEIKDITSAMLPDGLIQESDTSSRWVAQADNFAGSDKRLVLAASPRSRMALERIAEAADSGVLSEQDVLLLEAIANRFSLKESSRSESPHQRLRKKLNQNDPVSE